MSDLPEVMARSRRFAEQFKSGDLKIRPRLSTILLTCVDARVDPALLFGLELGDAVVIRNAGGRITPAVMSDMAITDPAKSVQEDIEQLRNMPGAPGQLVVSGLVYDVSDGTLKQVVPSAPLSSTG